LPDQVPVQLPELLASEQPRGSPSLLQESAPLELQMMGRAAQLVVLLHLVQPLECLLTSPLQQNPVELVQLQVLKQEQQQRGWELQW
jgi:hypothetical protein